MRAMQSKERLAESFETATGSDSEVVRAASLIGLALLQVANAIEGLSSSVDALKEREKE